MVRYELRKPSHGTTKVHELAVLGSLPAASSLFLPGYIQKDQCTIDRTCSRVRLQANFPLGNVHQFGVLCVTTQFYHCFSLISDTAK